MHGTFLRACLVHATQLRGLLCGVVGAFSRVLATVDKASKVKQFLFRTALAESRKVRLATCALQPTSIPARLPLWDKLVFAKVRDDRRQLALSCSMSRAPADVGVRERGQADPHALSTLPCGVACAGAGTARRVLQNHRQRRRAPQRGDPGGEKLPLCSLTIWR